MKGDFTRSTWNPAKRYSGVRQQQGRVQTDADWNEQVDISGYLREAGLGDLIGRCGAPRTGGGFKVGLNADATDLTLSAGRLYVDGVLCELAKDATYTAQLAGLDPALAILKPALPAATGTYFVFIDVWQRHVTALEDPAIRETALGGPDTATRTQTFWQVKLLSVDAGSNCLSAPQGWLDATAAPTGTLRARTHPGEPATGPCVVPANAGYTRLENQLYRVEVHQGGSLSSKKATFKWSRDNGSVVSEWLSLDNADNKKPKLTVSDAGRDKTLGFAPGQWVEVTDDTHEIQGTPGVLAKLLDVQGTVLTLDLAAGPALNLADFPVHPKVRRWDSAGAVAIAQPADNGGWLPLEDGVEVHFEEGTYRTGDYWLIPARAFIGEFSGDVEWPRDSGNNPVALPPSGVAHHFCKLAVVDFDAGAKKLSNLRDCRPVFPAVTELIQLLYVGGDGQEAAAGEMLPQPLEVRVANGRWQQEGVRVRFRVLEGKGRLDKDRSTPANPANPAVPPDGGANATGRVGGTGSTAAGATAVQELIATTGADGLAFCFWTLGDDGADPRQRVEAVLLEAAGNPLPGQVVHFNAGHRQVREPGMVVRDVLALADKKPLENDSTVNLSRLLDGVQVVTDRKLADTFGFPPVITTAAPPPFPPKPSFQVLLHLPFPGGIGGGVLSDFAGVVGFQPLLLSGTVTAVDASVQWVPTDLCRRWLQSALFQRLDPNRTPGFRLLVQVILEGRFIWSADDATVFLDGEAFGRLRKASEVGLSLPSGDGRRGGRFETWLWLVQNPLPARPSLTVSVTGNAVAGSVHDPTGAPLPGVKISLVIPGGASLSAVTSATGDFRFPQVPNGRLTVQAEVPGGAPLTQDITVGPIIANPGGGPILTNPVITNPVIASPVIARPAGPAEPGLSSTEPEPTAEAQKLTDVRGIGRARAAQLAGSGINTPADLAAAEPARLAEILGVPEETARTLIESARAVLGS